MLTVDTVTDAEIDALWRAACGPASGIGRHTLADPDVMHACTVATNRMRDFSADEQRDARRRVVEILNDRTRERCPARVGRDPEHVGATCEGPCCTACGGPIDDNEECRC